MSQKTPSNEETTSLELFEIIDLSKTGQEFSFQGDKPFLLFTFPNLHFPIDGGLERFIEHINSAMEIYPASSIFYSDYLAIRPGLSPLYVSTMSYDATKLTTIKNIFDATGPMLTVKTSVLKKTNYGGLPELIQDAIVGSHGVHIPYPLYVVMANGKNPEREIAHE